jgi:hypothetical protein
MNPSVTVSTETATISPSSMPATQMEATTSISESTKEQRNDRRISATFLNAIHMGDIVSTYRTTEDALLEDLQWNVHPKSKLLLRMSVILALFSLGCVCLWLLTTPRKYFWPMHIIYLSVLAVSCVFMFGSSAETWTMEHKLFGMSSAFCISTTIQLIIMNLLLGSYPWSVFPICLLLMLYTIHLLYTVAKKYFHALSVHYIIYVYLNFLFLVVYCYQKKRTFPWFLAIWFIWGVVLIVHVIVHKALQKRRNLTMQGALQEQDMHHNSEHNDQVVSLNQQSVSVSSLGDSHTSLQQPVHEHEDMSLQSKESYQESFYKQQE